MAKRVRIIEALKEKMYRMAIRKYGAVGEDAVNSYILSGAEGALLDLWKKGKFMEKMKEMSDRWGEVYERELEKGAPGDQALRIATEVTTPILPSYLEDEDEPFDPDLTEEEEREKEENDPWAGIQKALQELNEVYRVASTGTPEELEALIAAQEAEQAAAEVGGEAEQEGEAERA